MDVQTLWPFKLTHGPSRDPKQGACLLDAVSWFEYGCLGDHPKCVSPVLALFGQAANDWSYDTERQELKRFIPLLPGTVNEEADRQRSDYMDFAWQRLAEFERVRVNA